MKKFLSFLRKHIVVTINVALLGVSALALSVSTVAWYITQSKATVIGNNAVIGNNTEFGDGIRVFTGNGTIETENGYGGYDASTIDGKTINYNNDIDDQEDLYFVQISDEADIAKSLDFSRMKPGRYYSFALEETNLDYLSVLLDKFTPDVKDSVPYLEMYTGPLAIAKNIKMNTASWLSVHDLTQDNSPDSEYNFLNYTRMANTNSDIKNVTTTTNTHQEHSFGTVLTGTNSFDFVIFGDMSVGVYSSSQTDYVASTTVASSYRLYGYSNPQTGLGTSTGADATVSAANNFYYVDQATIDNWNTSNKHTKYLNAAQAVYGNGHKYTLSNTEATNNTNASSYISSVLAGTESDMIDYRYGEDIEGGLASAITDGDENKQYQLGFTEADNNSNIVFITFGICCDNSSKVKMICKRENSGGAEEKIFYAYHPQGNYEPYYGLDSGMGIIHTSGNMI